MNLIRTTSILTFVSTLVACGGGGGGGGGDSLLPPSNLSYGADLAFYLPGVSIPENSPTVEGTVESYSVSPALPAGLSLDPTTGVVSGSPVNLGSRASYTITATGPLGSTTAGIEFAVVEPPRFAFAASAEDDTLSTYVMDPATGILQLQAVRLAPAGEEDPGALVAHPSGSYVYSVNGAGNISHYRLDEATGRLDSRGTIATGNGPHAVAVAPNGDALYVLARGEDAVYAYGIDPDGALTQIGTPVATDLGAASITLSPEGTFVYVAQADASSVRTFAIDGGTGSLTQAGADTVFNGQSPVGVAVGPGGSWAFVALTDTSEVLPVEIDPVSGSLAPAPLGAATERAPGIVAVHPTEQFVYAATGDAGEVEVLSFDASTESLVSSVQLDLGSLPASITFDASGLYALISLPEEDRLAVFEVDLTDGSLDNELSVPSRASSDALALTIGSTAVQRIPEFLYVAGEDSNDVQAWSIDPENGGLAPLGVSVPAGSRPRSLAIDPLGRFAFAAGAGSRTIHTYTIENNGSWTDTGISLALDDSPRGLGIDPTGRYLYAALRNNSVLRSYAIDSVTGALTQLDEAIAGTDLRAMAVHPTGRFVYGSNFESSDISSYRVEEGLFVEGPFTTIATSRPDLIRFSPRGDRAFVGGGSSDILIPYSIDSRTGELTPIPPGKGVGDRPTVIDIAPSDRFAYAAISELPNGNGYVRFLLVNEETGGFLGGDAGAEISAGLNPTDLRVDPSESFLYVLNRTGSDISIFDLDPDTGMPSGERRVSAPVTPYGLQMTFRLQ